MGRTVLMEEEFMEEEFDYMEPVVVPITDTLDLHTFQPKEVSDLLRDYFEACIEKGIFTVRVIHGKGKGFLKKGVHGALKKNPFVKRFYEAPSGSGGWGATIVELKRSEDTE